ncbi:WhiB family transcriptional regulator [Saccharopolyspora cebuensis]|uniref:WhiB family transcriptional regulator n=1 Tax=Saccharopolyspora cebuensis TaxID=418759 RepID=UPI0031E5EE07
MKDWTRSGACREYDPRVFEPTGTPGSPGYQRQAQRPRAICAGCPVQGQCRQYVLTAGEPVGIWAGLDPDDRDALSRGTHTRRRESESELPEQVVAMILADRSRHGRVPGGKRPVVA